MKGSVRIIFGHMVLRPSIPSLREERVEAFAEFTIGRVIKNIFASNPYWGVLAPCGRQYCDSCDKQYLACRATRRLFCLHGRLFITA